MAHILSKINDLPEGVLAKRNKDLVILKYDRNLCDLEDLGTQESRGLIIDIREEKIVNYSMNAGMTYKTFKEKYPNTEDIIIEESIEGTLINVYFYKNKWNVSTKFCIDANRSRWSSARSFQELFNDIDFNYSKLNKNYCYSFVLCHPENTIVKYYETPYLVHVHTRDLNTLEVVNDSIGIQKPKQIFAESYVELENKLLELSYDCEGYMLYSKNREDRCKVKGEKYTLCKLTIGNYKTISQRILNSICKYDINFTYNLFEKQIVEHITQLLVNLIHKLDNIYTISKKWKQYINIPLNLRKHIYNIHSIYIERKANNVYKPISKKDIQNYVYSMNIYELENILLKDIQLE